MNNRNYSATIEVAKSPKDAFKHVNDVSKWWGGKDLKGSCAKLKDEFTVRHGDVHYSKHKVIEVIRDKKIVWLVTESKLNWLERDKSEWNNTKMVFKIITKGNKTVLHFTHEGLVPEKDCYERCSQGWDMVIKDWLFNFITDGKAHFK
jgi:Activator of Hsp90 ATPase homolog 1-like protein